VDLGNASLFHLGRRRRPRRAGPGHPVAWCCQPAAPGASTGCTRTFGSCTSWHQCRRPGSRASALRPSLQQASAPSFVFTAAAGSSTGPRAAGHVTRGSGIFRASCTGDSFPDGLPAPAYTAIRLHRDQLGVSVVCQHSHRARRCELARGDG
jgi:hypothetical protein